MDEGDPYQQHAIEVVNESVGEPVLGNYMGWWALKFPQKIIEFHD